MVYPLIEIISIVAKVYSFLILARVILSWVGPDPNNALVKLIVRVTEPIMAPVRNLLPAMGGFDFSPILVLIGIQVAESLVVRLLLGMAEG